MAGIDALVGRLLPSPWRPGGADTDADADVAVRVYTGLALYLVVLLVVLVPAGPILLDVAPGPILAVGVAGYALAVAATRRFFAGGCVALFVTAGFNASTYIDAPDLVGLDPYLVDVLAVVVLGSLVLDAVVDRSAHWIDGGAWRWLRRRDGALVVGSFACFVLWSFLSAVVGHGPESDAAFQFVEGQLRYGLVLVTAACVASRTDPRCVASPLALGIGGALVLAVDEVFAGTAGYLVDFGWLGRVVGQVWPSPSITSALAESSAVYRGTAVGQSRVMVGLGIVFVPLVLAVATRSGGPDLPSRVDLPSLITVPSPVASLTVAILSRGALLGVALLGVASVVASSSHAGILGLYGAIGCLVVHWTALGVGRIETERTRRLVVALIGAGGTLLALLIVAATADGGETVLFVRTNNLSPRIEGYATALDLAARYPLFGVGGGENVRQVVGTGVHNFPLAMLAATGIPGCLAYVTSQLATLWVGLRRVRHRADADRWLPVGVLGGVVGFHAYAFWVVAYRWESLNVVYWILVGVLLGCVSTATRGAGNRHVCERSAPADDASPRDPGQE